MWRVVVIGMVAGCVGISDEHKCSIGTDCPALGRCEPSGNCSAPVLDGSCGPGGFRYDDKSGERSGACVVDASAPFGVGPYLLEDQDDSLDTCGPSGARDVFVELNSPVTQILYAMTDPAVTNTSIALSVRNGPCPGAEPLSECSVQPCGAAPIGMVLAQIPAGRSCLIAEAADGATSGRFALQLYPAMRVGMPLSSQTPTVPDQTTCSAVSEPNMVCGNAADVTSAAYVLPVCPGAVQVSLTVTPSPPLDPLITVRPGVPYMPADPEACFDGVTGSAPEVLDGAQLTGPGAYWVLVEHAPGSSCGMFDLTGVSIAPI